ncbi:tRNA 2-thiocytidine(32) synthetase TtcA [Ahniella affigens]|uniref:tRNA-cytidine(32) 2-sulfurtransferase n=1 Tax=Ahniella affigens TaxID=2021234 RepID=A0A2P1PY19_9GAMM|nr:tRNA 2-thiocytidine(32) synthetase TtcA [Ahniella affigens]AVP99735.1 tRNA 2-thiocytidine(32) synthetase TtcA [Ahniella affigens]
MPAARKEIHEFNKLKKRLRRQVGQAIADFNMIEDGDRVMVCLSGGKDSYTMLDVLRQLQAKAPVSFELHAVHLDQKQPDYDGAVIPDYLQSVAMPFTILEQDTYSVVKRVVPEGKTMCGLCSRLRRGSLYTFAEREGFNKIALGHHRDDLVETMFLNLFYHAKLSSMPPKLRSDDGKHIVIRPLAYCAETDIADYAEAMAFPIIPCNLCGSQETLQRKVIKQMLQDWERQHPGRTETLFRALTDVRPSQLADPKLFDFVGLGARTEARLSEQDWLAGDTPEAVRKPFPLPVLVQ